MGEKQTAERTPKVVLLCGGRGTRLHEETEYRPKPLVPIGGMPILWHIMKNYSHHGFNEFVLCLGYKGNMIKDFFLNNDINNTDFTLDLKTNETEWHDKHKREDWKVTFAETGLDTHTGGRIQAVQKYLGDSTFMLTYGDGVGDIDLKDLLAFHKEKGKMVTITCVHPVSKFGVIKNSASGDSVEFVEKPPLKDFISGGFMVCEPEFLEHLDNSMFEESVLPALAKKGEIALYHHKGFWHAMDTYKDHLDLNKMWDTGDARWKLW